MAQLPHDDDTPIKQLQHEAVPGYLAAFVVAIAVMGLYLTIILISSPGSAKKKGYDKAATPEKTSS